MNAPCTVCRPGIRCQPCRERSIAHHRMYRLCRLWGPERHRDPVAYADQVTSMNDARTALCLAMGVPVEWIDPTTGHDRTPSGQLELAGVA